MALRGPFKIGFGEVFPHGAFAKGRVEPVRDFDRSSKDNFVQMRDKDTGLPVWQVEVIDADPESKGSEKVKIVAEVQPILPEPLAGFPFAPVSFQGFTINPYVNQAGKLAYSLKATGIVGPKPQGQARPAAAKDAA